jgi:GntR family transcriptional regulator, transcriptional repressor for pyruvate dehydrogenase complex
MPLRPISRRSVPDEVFDQLVADIVAGDLSPGEPLPSERQLAEVLGVSRPAVREALQRLAQANLVDIRQGDATTVRDYRTSAGLDLLPRLLLREGGPDLGAVRAVLEARAVLGPQVAGQSARKRDDAEVARLQDLVAQMQAQAGDLAALQDLAHALWDVVVDGTHNLVFRLLFNALAAAYLPVRSVLVEVLRDELTDLDGYQTLVAAVAAGDVDAACRAAEAVLAKGTARGFDLLDELAHEDNGETA